jgi:predicted enzyme related to lactoylglutathione lyase
MKTKKLIAWVEIPCSDFDRAVDFYCTILNLKLEKMDFGEEKMACFPNGEGAISLAPGFEPSENGVLISFDTGNELDTVINKVKKQGCTVVHEKTKIEAEHRGYFALFIDTEGNKLGLYGN